MVQILQTITFFDTEYLADWYHNHRINKKVRFLVITGNKTPQKTVFLAILTCFLPGDWWILTKIWFFKLFILDYTKVQQENLGRASFEEKNLFSTPLVIMCCLILTGYNFLICLPISLSGYTTLVSNIQRGNLLTSKF